MDTALPQKSLIGSVLQAVFPELCLECGERLAHAGFFCSHCGENGSLKRVGEIEPENGMERSFAFRYEHTGKTLFGAAKFSQRRRAMNFLIGEGRSHLGPLSEGSTLVLGLPSRRKFLQKLLRSVVSKEKLILNAFAVRRKLFGKDANKLLGEGERYKRIHENLVWAEKNLPAADRYILCDDVSTTGATLHHAAHLLQKYAGVPKEKITLWALMYRPRHFLMPRQ